MSRDVRVARATPVSECDQLLAIEPLLVRPEDDLLSVARRAFRQPETRVIGVVDEKGRLVGILPVLRLVEDVVARVAPESLMAGLSAVGDVARFGHAVEARTVADTMLPPASVRADATVDEAFRIMHRLHLSGLYVVDADSRVTGYLDLLELALRYVEAIEAAQESGGHDRAQDRQA